MSVRPSATFARATLEYDEEHERALLDAITQAIFTKSKVSDCQRGRRSEPARPLRPC